MNPEIDEKGNKCWFNSNRELHRANGPALIGSEGHVEWYKNGKWHREDGPAIYGPFGGYWYINGELHREDGPAVEYANGEKYWYINGKPIQ